MTNPNNLYFWLGADGEIEEVTEDQFELNQADVRRDREAWANVELGDAGDIVDRA